MSSENGQQPEEEQPLFKEIVTEVRKPLSGEVAIAFEEGGLFHVIPGAKIIVFGEDRIIYDSILEDRGEHPWRQLK